jgi:hypothetical protein
VISRADALKAPPKVCIVCGAAGTRVAHEWFDTLSNTYGKKFFPLLVPYCDRHYRKHLRWFIGSWAICLVVAALLVFFPHVDVTAVPPMVLFAVGLAGILIILLVYSQFRHVGFLAHEDYIEVSGASAPYVLAMHELQARRLDDVP